MPLNFGFQVKHTEGDLRTPNRGGWRKRQINEPQLGSHLQRSSLRVPIGPKPEIPTFGWAITYKDAYRVDRLVARRM